MRCCVECVRGWWFGLIKVCEVKLCLKIDVWMLIFVLEMVIGIWNNVLWFLGVKNEIKSI